MSSPVHFHFPTLWNAHDLANAVPLRLSELFAFDALHDGPVAASANAATAGTPPRAWRHAYLRNPALPALFRIHT